METNMRMVLVVFGVVAVVMLQCAAAQTTYVVGDSLGWKIPSNGAEAYVSWASDKTFVIGDTLIFNFVTNTHDVLQVTKDSYDTCTSTNPIGEAITTGPANITLTSAGDHYYICTYGSHCQSGQKLTITVSATTTPGAAPPPSTTASMLQCAAAQTTYVVGDSLGWKIPSNGAEAYVSWASDKTFVIGDTLIFNFVTNTHDVLQVTKDSYDTCTSTNPIGEAITTGPANITLTSAGDHYYICTYGSHCQSGQKLTITVSATTTPGAAPPPSTTASPPPSTPSPTSSTTPEACAPEPSAANPTANGPTTRQVLPPPDSSTPAVLGGFFATILSIAMAALF